MSIRVLPPEVINQIAAGEVIERPFSVVKELVENSLDAGATRIRVEIADGGKELIRVIDDGCGFSEDDLRLAFASHATSKLSELADLDHIASLGFRGEALASIGAVSRACVRSRQHGAGGGGFEVRSHGGALEEVRPAGCPEGSIIEVRDLFYNTPARRRFLKTAAAERARIVELMQRLALARLDVGFAIVDGERTVLDLPAGEPLTKRVQRAYGRQINGALLAVELEAGDLTVSGVVGEPDAARRTGALELLYVNGRCARDKGSLHAVRQAYREYLMPGRIPVTFLMLSLPPDQVDVNVHPSKAEVRFVDGRRVHGVLHEAVRGALAAVGGATAEAGGVQVKDLPTARSGFPDLPTGLFGGDVPGAAEPLRGVGPRGVGSRPSGRSQDPMPSSRPATFAEPTTARRAGGGDRSHPFARVAGKFLQVLDTYLLFEGDGGLVVVDQHALHERVLYEKLKRAHAARKPSVQRLLVPDVLELAPVDKAWLLDAQETLAEEGLLIDDFGGNSIAVQGTPAVLTRVAPAKLIDALLHGDHSCSGVSQERPPSAADAIAERFHSMACRRAIMAGDRLTDDEIRQLLVDAATLEHPHNCPHGRPTVVTFADADLQRYFKRTL